MKINLKNEEKVNPLLKEVERRAQVRTVGDLENFLNKTEDLFKKMDSMLPKKDQVGIVVDIDINAQNFPVCYMNRGNPESTHISIKRFPSGWFIIDCGRYGCVSWTRRYNIRLSEEQKRIAIEHVLQYQNW